MPEPTAVPVNVKYYVTSEIAIFRMGEGPSPPSRYWAPLFRERDESGVTLPEGCQRNSNCAGFTHLVGDVPLLTASSGRRNRQWQ